MKNLVKMFFSMMLLLTLATNIYAANITDEPECLPVALVAKALFTKAIPPSSEDDEKTVWSFFTDTFTYKDHEWNIGFAVDLPDAKTTQDAILKGTEYFQNEVDLKDKPSEFREGNLLICSYGYKDKTYIVMAATPPFTTDSSDGFLKAKLR